MLCVRRLQRAEGSRFALHRPLQASICQPSPGRWLIPAFPLFTQGTVFTMAPKRRTTQVSGGFKLQKAGSPPAGAMLLAAGMQGWQGLGRLSSCPGWPLAASSELCDFRAAGSQALRSQPSRPVCRRWAALLPPLARPSMSSLTLFCSLQEENTTLGPATRCECVICSPVCVLCVAKGGPLVGASHQSRAPTVCTCSSLVPPFPACLQ